MTENTKQAANEAENQDILKAAETMLVEPSKDVKRKILVTFNLIIGLSVLIYNIVTLVKFGNFNNPGRDWIMYPLLLGIMFSSGIYNLNNIFRGRTGNPFWNQFFAWTTTLVLQLISIVTVQANSNIALSFLWDVSLSLLLIFVTAFLIGKWAALVYYGVAIGNMLLVADRVGFGYVYQLEGFPEKDVSTFAVLWVLYLTVGILVAFAEGGMIGKILKVIPIAVSRIRAAGEEKKKLELENARMGAELDVAQRLQMMVLPRKEELKVCRGLEVAATMQPADEVGGDYYDILTKGEVTYVAVGDVTDHGLASGVVMLMAQSAFRILLEDPEPSLPDALNKLNSLLYKNVQVRLLDSRNMTLSLFRHERGRLTVCGQHEKVIVARAGGMLEFLDTADLGLYVGLVEDISATVNTLDIQLDTGDTVLLYTDGATEAEDPKGEQYGESRLGKALMRALAASPSTPDQILQTVKKDIFTWMAGGDLQDDITMVVFRKTEENQ